MAISERKKRKRGGQDNLAKTAEKLLAAQMRQQAVKEAQRRQLVADTGDIIDDDDEFLDDQVSTVRARGAPVRPGRQLDDEPPPKKKKYVHRDQYALPDLETSIQDKATLQDPRLATEEELREFIEDIKPEDFDVDGDWFNGLSTELKYEIIGDLRIKSRQPNKSRVEDMKASATPLDFSKAQIKFLMQRNDLTQKLLGVTDDISKAHISIPVRIASERNKHYVLVRNNDSDGGGWALGIRDEAAHGNSPAKPIRIDNSTTESDTEKSAYDSDGMFEAVPIPGAPQSSSPDTERRKKIAADALQTRYAPHLPPSTADQIPFLPEQDPLFRNLDQVNDDVLAAADFDPSLLQDIMAAVSQAQGGSSNLHQTDNPASHSHHSQPVASSSKLNTNTPSVYLTNHTSIPTTSFQHFQAQPTNIHDNTTSDSDDAIFEEVRMPSAPFVAQARFDGRHLPPAPQAFTANDQDSDDAAEFENVEISARPKINPEQTKSRPTTQLDVTSGLVQRDFAQTESTSPAKMPPAPPIASKGPPAPHLAAQGIQSTLEKGRQPSRPTLTGRRTSSTSFRASQSPQNSRTPSRSPTISRSTSLVSRPTMVYDMDDGARDAADEIELDDGPSLVAAALAQDSSDSDSPTQPSPRKIIPLKCTQSAKAVPQITTNSKNAPVNPANISSRLSSSNRVNGSVIKEDSPQLFASTEPDKPARPAQPTSKSTKSEPEIKRNPSPSPRIQDEEEEPIAWSPSPSPPLPHDFVPADFPLAEPGRELEDDAPDAGDLEEAELQANLVREEGHFAKFLHDLHHRNLDDVRNEVEEELRTLQAQKVVDRRNADDITAQMSKDIQSMLRLFGLPYLVAPMEAEAQCAELVSRSLVDGVITDDSDVFLFGGTRVYKNMFNQNKFVECYLLSDIERELSLTREKLITLAHFLGSDYTEGLKGVGPVLGMELMNEFPGSNGLVEFRQWWQRVQTGKDDEEDNASVFKRRFKKGKKDLFLDDYWPNLEVRKAYLNPTVDPSDERFAWGLPDLDGLRSFLSESLGWGIHKVDDLLEPLIKRMNQRLHGVANMQGTLDNFFNATSGGVGRADGRGVTGKPQSQRMQNVIKAWKQTQSGQGDVSADAKSQTPPLKRPRAPRKRSNFSQTSTSQSPAVSPVAERPPSISQPRTKRAQKQKTRQIVDSDANETDEPAMAPPPPRRQASTSKAKAKSPTSSKGGGKKLGQARKASERKKLHIDSDDSGWE